VKFAALIYLSLLLFILPVNADAQWMEQIQTESDWDYLYQDGTYDDISFQLYRDMAEGIAPGDTTEYVAKVLGNSITELSSLPINAENHLDTAASSFPLLPEKPSLIIRSGQRLDNGKSSAYYSGNVTWGNISLNYKGRNFNNQWTTEHRAIYLRNNKIGLTLGNFTADIGQGLGIGRYDFRPVTGISEVSEDFLYPQNSYYNGIKIDYSNFATLIVSQKKFGSLKKGFLGSSLSYRAGEYLFGITASAMSLSTTPKQAFGSGSIFIANSARGLLGEIGYCESGVGLVTKIKKDGFDIRLWHYDNGFTNLESSSYAHPDYIIFRPDSSSVGFRQAQSGESGLLIRKAISIGCAVISGGSEIWKRTPESSVASDISITGRVYLGQDMSLGAGLWDRQGSISARSISQLGFYYQGSFSISPLISFWVADGAIVNSRSFSQIYCRLPVNSNFTFASRIRHKFDSHYECFLEEKTVLGEHFSLKGTYRIQNNQDNKTGPLYIVMEGSF
jgi:hypothetical protein